MHKKVAFIICLITLVIYLAGCTDLKSAQTQNKNKEIETQPEQIGVTNDIEKFTLEKKLLPPKFLIKNFSAKYNEVEKVITYQLDYVIDQEIYDSLTIGNQKMYFSLEYPENVLKYFDTISSEQISTETPKDNKMNFKVSFNQKVIKDINKQELKDITSNLERYNLNIADNDKDVISIFNDIYGIITYMPGVSKSEHIDETGD